MGKFRIPTVTVEDSNRRGWKVINEADFDPDKHKIYKEKPTKAEKKAEKKAEETDENATSSVAKMKKDELVAELDLFGLDTEGTVAELRERLTSAMAGE